MRSIELGIKYVCEMRSKLGIGMVVLRRVEFVLGRGDDTRFKVVRF